jgi:S-methylmethionine-dependent homocysteine/selenocysteine methylase
MEEIRAVHEEQIDAIVISGCIGPRADAYAPAELMDEPEAERYHSDQLQTFSETAAEMATALTLTYAEEAVGIVRAAAAAGLPIVISFTVETDGRLPSGQALDEAIDQVDSETGAAAAYYMVNCAHPTHFAHVLADSAIRWSGSPASGPTPRPRVMPSSMTPTSSMTGIRPTWALATASSASGASSFGSSEGAAAPITGT